MTVLNVLVDGLEKSLYMDNKLYTQLTTKVKPNIHKKDKDWVGVIDGGEGVGKSVLAMQIAKVLDPNFNLKKVCMTPNEFTTAIVKARKGDCIVFDEAFTGLSSRASLTEVNKIIVSLMMEMRQKNLFVLIVMPTFFLLDKYVALWRAKGLFHVYLKKGKRGRWVYFNNKKKKLLYILGKKLYDYSKPRVRFRGRFQDQYTVNEKDYRDKKNISLRKKSRLTKAQVYLEQRNVLIWVIISVLKINHPRLAKLCRECGFPIDRTTITKIILDKKKELLEIEAIREKEEDERLERLEKEAETLKKV